MCDFVKTTFCRLCLNITEGQQTADLTGDKQLCTILENVFPGMRLELIQTPKICLTCKDKLQFAYIFKNNVLCNEHKIESNKDCLLNDGIDMCRLCLKEQLGNGVVYLCENNNFLNQPIRTVIEIATGPLNFNNLKKPTMCTKCWSSVKDTYVFKKHCFDNEEKLYDLYKTNNNGLTNNLSTEEVLTTIILKEKPALIRTGDKENRTLNTHSQSQSVVNLDSEHIMVSTDNKTFPTYSTNTDPVLISDYYFDNDTLDSKIEDEHSDSDCSEDIFDEEINDDVVEIRIRKRKNIHDKKLNISDVKNHDVAMDVDTSKSRRFLGEIKEEFVKDEMSFEEHDIDFKGFSFEDESKMSMRKTSLVELSEHQNVKLETTNRNRLSATSVEKSLTIRLIDCLKYQSDLNMIKSTIKKETDSQPHAEFRSNINRNRTIECGECDFVTSSKEIMSSHKEKHIIYSDTGNKCPNCQKVYRNPGILEEHVQDCEKGLSKKVSAEESSKTTGQIFKRQKCNNMEMGGDITSNKTTGLDQNNADAVKPSGNSQETSFEAFKTVVYQCSNCSYNTIFRSEYVFHLKDMHNMKFICDVCQKGYNRRSALELHRLRHCEEERFSCDVCQKIYKTKFLLRAHQLTHCTDKNNICDICKYAFKHKGELTRHRLLHCEDDNFACDVCQERFKRKDYLISHMVKHCAVKNYICNICEKAFKRKSELSRHQVIHYDEKKIVCDVCRRKFTTKSYLILHLATHRTVPNYICDICQRGFKRKSCLIKHHLTHREDRKFGCDVCQKRFKRKYNLTVHQSIHTTVRNYICNICDKAFKQQGVLNEHRLRHFKEWKFVCDVCQKRFSTNRAVKRHKQGVHRESSSSILK